jgi:hypothetical protein
MIFELPPSRRRLGDHDIAAFVAAPAATGPDRRESGPPHSSRAIALATRTHIRS